MTPRRRKSRALPTYAGRKRILEELAKRPAPTLYAFDFDGTLVGFRKDPEKVVLSPRMRAALLALARTSETALLSGRGFLDLKKKGEGLPLHLAGSHGFEIRSKTGRSWSKGTEAWKKANTAWKRAIQAWIEKTPLLRGAWVEDKRYSLTVHFRECKDPALAHQALIRLIRGLSPAPRHVAGHLVSNLLPRVSKNKGEALLEMMARARCASAVFIGDDVTDEDVFRLQDPRILSIRVGGSNQKVPADLHLRDRAAVLRTLGLFSRWERERQKPTQSPNPLEPARKKQQAKGSGRKKGPHRAV